MSQMSVYNLSEIPEFARLLSNSLEPASEAEDNKYINVTNYSTKSNEKYRIVRYDKKMLAKDQISNHGLFRSVIINSANKVVCFSISKNRQLVRSFGKKLAFCFLLWLQLSILHLLQYKKQIPTHILQEYAIDS